MSLNEEIKKVIIEQCKDAIAELSEVTSENLLDIEILEGAWDVIQQASENNQFNSFVNYIISHINNFTEESEDDFTYIYKIPKTSLNTTSILFYYENSGTCLLCDDDNYDITISILSKIILSNFESILHLENDEIAIFQKNNINTLCLTNKEAYAKILLINIGFSIKDDIIDTQKIFLEEEQLTCNKNYLQYKDAINILNKYNNTSDILWKFLLLYQILENFSYRRSIARNLRDNLSLNIKHLSSVYTSSRGEGVFIKDSIKKFLLNINNKTYFTYENNISLELSSSGNVNNPSKKIKLNNITDTNIKDIAEFLNIKLQKINSHEVLSQEIGEIIYVLRNCIVHNKETEWIHINNSLLQEKPELKIFFEKFILPTMEFLVKELIFKENSIIDYPNDKPNYLLIWGEEPNPPANPQESNYHETSSSILENNDTSIFNRFKFKFLECKSLISSWWA